MRAAFFSRRSTLLAAAASFTLLSGCVLGPDYQKPDMQAPAAFAEAGPWAAAVPKDAVPKENWWTVFNDSALNDLESKAASASPTLAVALSRADQARALVGVSRADLLPAFSVNAAGGRERFSGNREVSPGAGHTAYTTDSFELPLDLTYEIDLFGRARREVEGARASAQAAQADYENVLLSVEADVALDYFSLRTLALQRGFLAHSVDGRRQELDLVQKRRSGGASDDLDVYRAQAELDTVASQLLSADQQISRLKHALSVLIGTQPESFTLETPALSGEPPAIPVGLPSELLERRPDVAEAERTLAAASARIGFAKAAFFPSIGLTAETGFNSSALSSILTSTSRDWSILPFVSVPLFQGGRNKANYEAAKAAYAGAVAAYRGQVLVAFRDVEDGLSDLRYLSDQAKLLTEGADASRKAADLSQLRYKQGVADYFEVIDAERTALDDEITAAQLRGQRFAASILLIKGLGGGWQAR